MQRAIDSELINKAFQSAWRKIQRDDRLTLKSEVAYVTDRFWILPGYVQDYLIECPRRVWGYAFIQYDSRIGVFVNPKHATEYRWTRFVIAHELAHAFRGHLHSDGDAGQKEMEADETALGRWGVWPTSYSGGWLGVFNAFAARDRLPGALCAYSRLLTSVL